MKNVRFVGSSKEDMSAFPTAARLRAGHELFMVQAGREPSDWKPLPEVGSGACEIRIRDEAGAFRVIYVAKFADAIYVLHAFRKKAQKTAQVDLDLAERRYREAQALAKELSHGKGH
ncbi:MAG: type II toxin-antitoxin system RelE/ParE family toxin [Betaproteobacteria bacterium]|nr:type II toxin-antitoxin system RelE/ParE family toxin [Betaproteobacteria bacterium]